MFQLVEQARQSQNNPVELFKQITNKYTPEQMSNFFNQAEQIGFNKEFPYMFKHLYKVLSIKF